MAREYVLTKGQRTDGEPDDRPKNIIMPPPFDVGGGIDAESSLKSMDICKQASKPYDLHKIDDFFPGGGLNPIKESPILEPT